MISQHYHTGTPSSRRYTTGLFMTLIFRVTAIISVAFGITSASNRNTNYSDNKNIQKQWNHPNYNYHKDSMGSHTNYYTTYNLVRIRLDDYDATFTRIDENRSSFPVAISMFCPVNTLLVRPIRVVQIPENYTLLLCDPTITTEEKFRIMLQYDNNNNNFHGPVAIAVPSSSSPNNTYCTMDEMISNIERMNEISLGYNNITHLILPKSYQPIKNNSLITTTTTANSWTAVDPCLYSNIITLFVTDDSIYKIESEIIKEYSLRTTNSFDQFLLMKASDDNKDGIIVSDDNDTYSDSISDSGPFVRDHRSLSSSSGGINSTVKIWIIVGFGFLVLGCCFGRYGIREAQNVDRLRTQQRLSQQEQQRNIDNDPSLDNSKKKKAALTEAEFATLPRIAYYLITMQDANTDSNNEVTEPHVVPDDANVTPVNQSVVTQHQQQQQQQLNLESSKNNDEHNSENKSTNHDIKENIASNNLDIEKTNNENSDHIIINNRNDGCSICLEEFQHDEIIISLPRCSHLFHTKCIGEWLLERKKHTCPLCKTPILLPVIKDDGSNNNVSNEEV